MATTPLAYTVRKTPRARHIRITIKPSGDVILTVPMRASVARAEEFLAQKAVWIARTRERLMASERTRLGTGTREEYLHYKPAALRLVQERIAVLNAAYGFTFTRIGIRNQKTRWGSCSRRGALSFNYRIALLPPHLADYLIVHELCHLQYMSHGPRFWALVAKTVPNWRECRRLLQNML